MTSSSLELVCYCATMVSQTNTTTVWLKPSVLILGLIRGCLLWDGSGSNNYLEATFRLESNEIENQEFGGDLVVWLICFVWDVVGSIPVGYWAYFFIYFPFSPHNKFVECPQSGVSRRCISTIYEVNKIISNCGAWGETSCISFCGGCHLSSIIMWTEQCKYLKKANQTCTRLSGAIS